jgi:hypothetical protein
MEDQRAKLRNKLRKWEDYFEKKYGRFPTKDDIRRYPEVQSRYKEYRKLKGEVDVNTTSSSSNQHYRPESSTIICDSSKEPDSNLSRPSFDANTLLTASNPDDGQKLAKEPGSNDSNSLSGPFNASLNRSHSLNDQMDPSNDDQDSTVNDMIRPGVNPSTYIRRMQGTGTSKKYSFAHSMMTSFKRSSRYNYN